LSKTQLTTNVRPETRGRITSAMAEFGFSDRGEFFDMLFLAYSEGRLAVLDRVTKECLVSAAEDRVLTKAKRAARDETHLVLFEEGYRATPFDS